MFTTTNADFSGKMADHPQNLLSISRLVRCAFDALVAAPCSTPFVTQNGGKEAF
jgi:hypothetical protein